MLARVSKLEKYLSIIGKTPVYLVGVEKVKVLKFDEDQQLAVNPLPIFNVKDAVKADKAGDLKAFIKNLEKDIKKGKSTNGIHFLTFVSAGGKGIVLIDDKNEEEALVIEKVMKALCKMIDYKPLTAKQLKKTNLKKLIKKVSKGKKKKRKDAKKEARKELLKLLKTSKKPKGKAYGKIKENYKLDIYMLALLKVYEKKGGLNKKRVTTLLAEFIKHADLKGKGKGAKKATKKLKKLLKVEEIEMPSLKKINKGKVQDDELVLIVTHMASIKYGFGTPEYFENFKESFSVLQTNPKDVEAIKGAIKKAAEKASK
jgi:hypothetical protein